MADASFGAAASGRYIPPGKRFQQSPDLPATPAPVGRKGHSNDGNPFDSVPNTSGGVQTPRYAIPDTLRQQSPIDLFKKELPKGLRELDTDYLLIAFRKVLLEQLSGLNIQAARMVGWTPQYILDTGASLAFINALADTIERVKRETGRVSGSVRRAQIEKLLGSWEEEHAAMTKDNAGYAAALQEYPDIHATILHSLETLRQQLHQLKGSNDDAVIPAEAQEPVPILEHRSSTKALIFWAMMILLAAAMFYIWHGK